MDSRLLCGRIGSAFDVFQITVRAGCVSRQQRATTSSLVVVPRLSLPTMRTMVTTALVENVDVGSLKPAADAADAQVHIAGTYDENPDVYNGILGMSSISSVMRAKES